MADYDALLIASFGGPEGPDEVMPFLENVVRGRDVPRARLLEVAEHYHHFGGKSPIGDRTRELIEALGPHVGLPIYWGNRFWHPMLADTLRRMRDDGVERAIAFTTSALSSYSSCRAYLESFERARAEVGPGAPELDKIRPFFDHPGYVETCRDRLREAIARAKQPPHVIFTGHSIPLAMARGCDYAAQLEALAGWVAEGGQTEQTPSYELVYQSRSGPPEVPWLGPDVLDALRARPRGSSVIVHPIGFVADHMEVVWDLDEEARALAGQLGLDFVRAGTAGAHPRFVSMIAELIAEKRRGGPRLSLWPGGPRPEPCPAGCCPSGARPSGSRLTSGA